MKVESYGLKPILTGVYWVDNCYIVSHATSREQLLIDP